MCGIAGVLTFEGRNVVHSTLDRMSEALYERGPDDSGTFISGPVGLIHRRLSIIDLSGAGRCPMNNEDGTVTIVFNGEIFNYRDLQRELKIAGHVFRSHSDTEVVLHGFEEWGTGVLARLNGMFAFAIWESGRRRLFLARDRMGEKPLYYLRTHEGFIFASTLAALHCGASRRLTLNHDAIRQYLCFGYVPGPMTIWKDCRSIMPSHFLVVDDSGAVRTHQYWDFPREERAVSMSNIEEEVEQALDESVRSRLISDVPVGGFLSGGVDSSLVMALAARHSGRLTTFSVGFEHADYSELHYARLVADHIGSHHHEILLREDDLISCIPFLVWHYGQPYGDASSLATFLVSKFASQHVKVCLSGDGGDEAFGGYRRALVGWYASIYRRYVPEYFRMKFLPALLSSSSRLAASSTMRRMNRLNQISLHGPAATNVNALSWREGVGLIMGEQLRESSTAVSMGREGDEFWGGYEGSFLRQVLYHDYRVQLAEDYLVKVDIASMAASLELRAPFIDHRFVEFAWRLPDNVKIRNGAGKWVLKRIAARNVPRSVIYRKKMGFALPMKHLWMGRLGDVLTALMHESVAVKSGWIRPEPVRAALKQHRTGRARHDTRLWLILWLELWARMILERSIDRNTSLLTLA